MNSYHTFTFQDDSVVVAQITYQSLFKLYPKLSGMTGTAKTEVWMTLVILRCYLSSLVIVLADSFVSEFPLLQENEFLKMFQIPVIEVPTNLQNIRNDLPTLAFAVRVQHLNFVRTNSTFLRYKFF